MRAPEIEENAATPQPPATEKKTHQKYADRGAVAAAVALLALVLLGLLLASRPARARVTQTSRGSVRPSVEYYNAFGSNSPAF